MLCLSVLDGEYIAWSDNLKKRKWEVPVVFFLSILIVDPSQTYNYPLAINRFSIRCDASVCVSNARIFKQIRKRLKTQ